MVVVVVAVGVVVVAVVVAVAVAVVMRRPRTMAEVLREGQFQLVPAGSVKRRSVRLSELCRQRKLK